MSTPIRRATGTRQHGARNKNSTVSKKSVKHKLNGTENSVVTKCWKVENTSSSVTRMIVQPTKTEQEEKGEESSSFIELKDKTTTQSNLKTVNDIKEKQKTSRKEITEIKSLMTILDKIINTQKKMAEFIDDKKDKLNATADTRKPEGKVERLV
jgi:hypothetical protein